MRVRLIIIGFLFLCLYCVKYIPYTPDPEKDIGLWVENFTRQRSFRYSYVLKTPIVFTEAQGVCHVERCEHVTGLWRSDDRELTFEYYGFNDIEYSRESNQWTESSRGDEADIVTQVNRLLEFDKFEYVGLSDQYVYRFKANIPFLIPGRWKEMTGVLKISPQTYLPEIVWAGLADSTAYWEIFIHHYNTKQRIEPPMQDKHPFVLRDAADYWKKIERRFELVGIECELKPDNRDVILTLPSYYTIGDVEEVLSSRTLKIYGVTMDKEKALRVAYLLDNKSLPVLLSEEVLDEADMKDAKIHFDGASTPFIEVGFNKRRIGYEEIVYEVDGVLHGVATLDTLKKMDKLRLYLDMTYNEMQQLRAVLLQPLPLIDIDESVEGVR
jgi:hypothetical protein